MAAPSKKEDWIATDETPPLETAVVYESESSAKCGCNLQMEPLVEYLENSANKECPVCQIPIEVVCDGMAKPLGGAPHKNVTFKYRKHLYNLSVMRSSPNLAFPYSWCLWMWHTMLFYVGEDTSFTAQERIAHVLQMDLQGGMKVSSASVTFDDDSSL